MKVIDDSIAYLGAAGGIYKITNFPVTGIQTADNRNIAHVYPAIFSETITIELSDLIAKSDCHVSIIGLCGQLISKQSIHSGTTRLNLHNLPDGIYFVKIAADDFSCCTKIVKVN